MQLRSLLPALGLLAFAGPAAANPPSASAGLFAERTALLAADGQCRLLDGSVRAALSATTLQARSAALRDGWSAARLDTVAQKAKANGRTLACTDKMLLDAVASADAGFKGWAKMPSMEFAGGFRTWSARRAPDLDGWLLAQTLTSSARFGIRQTEKGDALTLAVPWSGSSIPVSASLYLRDVQRAPKAFLDIPGRAPRTDLAGAMPSRAICAARFASGRTMDRGKTTRAIFTFPPSVLSEMAALDPREAVAIEITPSGGGAPVRFYVEVGDLAAARAFLAAR